MRINTNIASLTALESTTNTNKNLTDSLSKLSSGLRINKAADDASGLAIADKLRTQASSLSQGISNANSGVALLQIADKAMSEQSNILDTIKTKLIQASTSTTSDDGKEAIRKDINKLLEQFDSVASSTNYNGTTLLQRSATDTANSDKFRFQLGEAVEFNVSSTPTTPSNTDKLGGGTNEFGATSINSSITYSDINTANAVGGNQVGSGLLTDNNIDTFGAQQINTSSKVTIEGVNVSGSGIGLTEAADTANTIDITISGDIGKLSLEGEAILDISSETEEVKQAVMEAVRDASNADIKLNADGNVSISAASLSLDLSNINFSSLNIQNQAADKYIELNADNSNGVKTFTIENNFGQNQLDAGIARSEITGISGQINIATNLAATSSMVTGGPLLSDLKELQAGELTSELANTFMLTIDLALTQVNTLRSDFGSSQNQLESSIRNMQTTHTNLKNAESVIRDVDYAEESANFNKTNIIAQAGTYAISQANNVQQNIMKLLQ
ncbi:MAG: flagellin [Campylobacterota bacterium]|nr:flagellin [Campylobacterota bacterium]